MMYPTRLLVLLFALALGQPGFAAAQLTEKQGDAVVNELRQLRQALERMQQQEQSAAQTGAGIVNELRQIRQVLERMQQQGTKPQAQAQAAAPKARAKVSTKGKPELGSDDAPVTVVEFADYQCPFCKRFFSTTLPALKKEYIDTGKVRFVLKDLPLPMHSNARPAAIATYCAGEQGKFWAMHDKLFTGNGQLTEELLKSNAKDIGLNAEKFADCLNSDRYDEATSADATETSKQGITGTPTFVVGRTTDDIIEGSIIGGAQPIEAFRAQIEPLLKQDKKNPS